MLCANLDGSESRGKWICMTESLCCLAETITTLLIGHTAIQNEKFNKKEKKIIKKPSTVQGHHLGKILLLTGSYICFWLI